MELTVSKHLVHCSYFLNSLMLHSYYTNNCYCCSKLWWKFI